MKFKFLFIVVSVTFLLWVLASAVLAQEEPPPPYAGLKNPFPWSDASAQEAGKGLYQSSCLGCHGADGGNIAGADFSAADFPQRLEERPAFYFWTLSEGRLNKGMPPFKSSLSEQQRWQALTYLRSLGTEVPPEVTPPTKAPAEGVDGTLLLTVPEQAQSGQPLTLTAIFKDKEGKPIGDIPVRFFIGVDFFTSDLIEVAEAVTNGQGIAVSEYIPRQTGEIQVVARYEAIETTATVSLKEVAEPFYQAEAGLPDASSLPEIFIGPKSAFEPEQEGNAPTSGLRVPGGLPSLLLLAYVFAVILVWSLYFRVWYQMFRIPVVRGTDRLLPTIGLVTVVALATLLVFILITGPYSHPHLLR
jgi:mono/diheme cytochrome c family protein